MTNQTISQKLNYLILTLTLWLTAGAGMAQTYSLGSDNAEVEWTVEPVERTPGVEAVRGVVPGTVFGAYVLAGREKDPNWGDNIQQVDRKKYDRSFRYCTSFRVPEEMSRDRLWLNMDGVNRSAEVVLNGKRLGRLDGFMERGRFDITDIVRREAGNELEVTVDIPRTPLANQGSPNYLSSAGWDWMPYVPGLNSGITDKVWLSGTGQVTMQDPWIRSELVTHGKARLSVTVKLTNHTQKDQLTRVRGVIQPSGITFEKEM